MQNAHIRTLSNKCITPTVYIPIVRNGCSLPHSVLHYIILFNSCFVTWSVSVDVPQHIFAGRWHCVSISVFSWGNREKKLAYRWESCAISINFFVTIHVLMLQSRHTTLSTLFLYVVYGRQDKPASSHQTYHCFEHPATTCFVQSMLVEIHMINMHWSQVSNRQRPPPILLSTLDSTFSSHKIYEFYSIPLPFLEDSASFSYSFSFSSISDFSFSAHCLSRLSFCSCALWPQSTTDITATICHLK